MQTWFQEEYEVSEPQKPVRSPSRIADHVVGVPRIIGSGSELTASKAAASASGAPLLKVAARALPSQSAPKRKQPIRLAGSTPNSPCEPSNAICVPRPSRRRQSIPLEEKREIAMVSCTRWHEMHEG